MLIVAAGLACTASTALAADWTHRIGVGENVEQVARAYYGASWKAIYLTTRNGYKTGQDIKSGTRLVIPACWLYKVQRGDTIANIAKRQLGAGERATAILQANNLSRPDQLEVGAELLMPFHLRHVVQAGETLPQIAREYYRNTRYAMSLAEYNKLDTVKPGQIITVPIFDRAALDVKARAYTPPNVVAAPTAPAAKPVSPELAVAQPAPTPAPVAAVVPAPAPIPAPTPATVVPATPAARKADLEARLKKGVADYRAGAFDQACPAMETLLDTMGFLVKGDQILLTSHLGFCAVAYDDRKAAADYFHKWIELDPKANPSPVTTSPKILTVFEEVVEAAHGNSGEHP